MYRYTLAKFILLLSLTISSFNSMAKTGTNYNRKGVVIKYDTPQANHVRYNTGDSAELNGSICVSKYSSIFNKLKCRATLQGNVSVRAYFPDAMTEVTDQLKIKKKGQEYQWSFKTPELISGNENTLHILVATDDPKIKKYERLQAKLNKRIVLLEKRIQHRNKRGSNVRLISWLNDLKDRLERVSKNIDELIEEDASVLAQIKIPLQVDNDVAFPFYYSSFFSGHKMSLRAPIGSAVEGDRVTVEASSKNLSGKSFWFPGIDDKNDKNDESFNDDGLNQYKLDLYFNNALKVSSGFSEIAYGQENKITFNTDKLSIYELNNFDLKLTKKLNLHFKSFKKKVSLDFPYGEIGFTLPVSIDDVKPTISTDFFSEGETSLSKFENVKYLAKDGFGHLVNDSISIEIKNAQDEAVSGTSVTSAKINAEEVEYNVSNLSLADGSYQITALIKDNAGNESTKLVNEFFIDNSAPTLIENNTPNGFITGDKLDLNFKVGDVSSVEVIVFSNGEKLLTTSNKHVQESITLSSGENIISAKLTDSLGNTATVNIATVSIDNDAPALANNSTLSGYTASSSLALNFSVTDISTVTTEVLNNGTKVLATTNKSVNESIILSSGINNVTVVMTDAAGNVSNAEISSITLDNVSPILSRNGNTDSVLSTSSYTLDFTVQDSTLVTTTVFNNGSKILETNENLVNNTITLSYGVNEITVSMSDSAGNTSSANIAKLTLDNKKPVLAQNNTQGGLTANNSLPLDISIEDLTAVDIKVLRNGIEVLSSIEKVIKTSIELVEGNNEITAVVLDQAGNTESFTIAQVIYDGTKPTISSINLVEDQSLDSLTYELNGVVSEELSSLSINGDSVSLNESSFSYTISNTEEGAKSVVIAMSDVAGNTNELTINYAVQLVPEEFECLKQDFSEAAACSEEFIAQSFADVESYKSSSDLNSKNLVLAFSYSGDEHLNIHTPCSINIAENFSFSTTGGICLDSRNGLNIQTQSQVSANEVNLFSDTLINIEENASLNSVESFSASSPECTFKNTSLSGSGNCFDPSRPIVKVSTTKTNLEIGEILSFSTSESLVPNGISTVEFFINNLKQEISTNSFNHTFNEEGIFYVKAKITDSNGYISSDEIKINVSAPIINTREAFFKYAVEDELLELIFVQSIPRDQIKTAKFVVDGQDYVLPNYYHLDSIYINDISLGNHNVILEVTDIYDQVFKYQRSVFVGTNEEMAQLPPVMEFEVVPSAPRKVFIEFRDVFDPAKLFDGLVIDWGDGQESEHWIPDEGGVKHQYASAGTYEVSVEFIKYGDEELVTTLTKEVVVADDEVSPAPPIVNFRYEKQYFAPHVTFNVDLSMSPTGEIVSRTFDYGDGTVFTGNEPIHTHFYDPGTYYPTLTIVDEYGMTASQTARVIIAEEGEDFISHLECFDEGGLYVGCDVVALAKDEEIQSIEIDWGDGNTETFDPAFSSWTWDFFDYEYSTEDDYVIQAVVKTDHSEYNTSFSYSNINQPPKASFNCYFIEEMTVFCDSSSSSDDDEIVEYEWTVDGITTRMKNLTHTFDEVGTYPIELTVYDGSQNINSFSMFLNVASSSSPPVISLSGSRYTNIVPYDLELTVNSDDNTLYDFSWSIIDSHGDIVSTGEGEQILTQIYNYDKYQINISVKNQDGSVFDYLFYAIADNNNTSPAAVISQSEKMLTYFGEVKFDSKMSYDENDSISVYEWYINNSLVSNQESFVYEFNSLGVYDIKLIVADNFGSKGEARGFVEVVELVSPYSISEYEIKLKSPLSSTYAILNNTSNVELVISSGAIFDPDSLDVYVNNLKTDQFFIENNMVSINYDSLPIGEINLSVTTKDQFGNDIVGNYYLYKATKVENFSQCEELVSKHGDLVFSYQIVGLKFKESITLDQENCILPLMPQDSYTYTIVSKNSSLNFGVVDENKSLSIDEIVPISEPSTVDNNDLSNGLQGWSGDINNVSLNGTDIDFDTRYPAKLKRTFVSDKDQSFIVTLDTRVVEAGTSLFASLRGGHGDSVSTYLITGDENNLFRKVDLTVDVKKGEVVELYIDYVVEAQSYSLNNIFKAFSYLFDMAYATDSTDSNVLVLRGGVRNDTYGLRFFPVKQSGNAGAGVFNSNGEPLTHLSFSRVPEHYMLATSSTKSKKIPINAEDRKILGKLYSVNCVNSVDDCTNLFSNTHVLLRINIAGVTYDFDLDEQDEVMNNITQDVRSLFTIKQSSIRNISASDLNRAYGNNIAVAQASIVIEDVNTNQELASYNIDRGFKLLSHIPERVVRYNNFSGKTSITNMLELDGWATPTVAESFAFFYDEVKEGSFGDFNILAVGDISFHNGYVDSSHTTGHRVGREVDIMTSSVGKKSLSANNESDTYRNNVSLVKEVYDLFDQQESSFSNQYVQWLFVTFSTSSTVKDDELLTDFNYSSDVQKNYKYNIKNDVRGRCFGNGRLLEQYMVDHHSHDAHMHLSFVENKKPIYKRLPDIKPIPNMTSYRYRKTGGDGEYEIEVLGDNFTRFYLVYFDDSEKVVEFYDSGKGKKSLKAKLKQNKNGELAYYKVMLINDPDNTIDSKIGANNIYKSKNIDKYKRTLASCSIEDVSIYMRKGNLCDNEYGFTSFESFEDEEDGTYFYELSGFTVDKALNYSHSESDAFANEGSVFCGVFNGTRTDGGSLTLNSDYDLYGEIETDSEIVIESFMNLDEEDSSNIVPKKITVNGKVTGGNSENLEDLYVELMDGEGITEKGFLRYTIGPSVLIDSLSLEVEEKTLSINSIENKGSDISVLEVSYDKFNTTKLSELTLDSFHLLESSFKSVSLQDSDLSYVAIAESDDKSLIDANFQLDLHKCSLSNSILYGSPFACSNLSNGVNLNIFSGEEVPASGSSFEVEGGTINGLNVNLNVNSNLKLNNALIENLSITQKEDGAITINGAGDKMLKNGNVLVAKATLSECKIENFSFEGDGNVVCNSAEAKGLNVYSDGEVKVNNQSKFNVDEVEQSTYLVTTSENVLILDNCEVNNSTLIGPLSCTEASSMTNVTLDSSQGMFSLSGDSHLYGGSYTVSEKSNFSVSGESMLAETTSVYTSGVVKVDDCDILELYLEGSLECTQNQSIEKLHIENPENKIVTIMSTGVVNKATIKNSVVTAPKNLTDATITDSIVHESVTVANSSITGSTINSSSVIKSSSNIGGSTIGSGVIINKSSVSDSNVIINLSGVNCNAEGHTISSSSKEEYCEAI